jgi:predicted DNA-binding transcriptional regulator AlpA
MQSRVVRFPELQEMLGGISRNQVAYLEEFENFPPRIRLGARAIGWDLIQVQTWLQSGGAKEVVYEAPFKGGTSNIRLAANH